MNEQSGTASSVYTSTGIGILNSPATKLAAPASPLDSVLAEHEVQIAKLGELISTLANRLAPVRNITPQANEVADKNTPVSSAVVGRVATFTDEVKYLQSRIGEVLQDLEV